MDQYYFQYMRILDLAAKLRAGKLDQDAENKLQHEYADELLATLPHRDQQGNVARDGDLAAALTELADVVYYACKLAYYNAQTKPRVSDPTGWRLRSRWIRRAINAINSGFQTVISIEDAYAIAIAKYELRARPGNPKDDAAERAACMAILSQ